ncbi:hypothetical protein OXPF_41560 [Oxobacter pfennigii]|uniref:Uncharacterized protein n=1 Tax=Oxobacter pfennigii TaxID=36849 RepID=A0A0P8W425_9CLOT|nr:hypothetical protein [Oxobacter pfennigii]KPU42371.1 hypothetical protein OXPF_41560 [Oxobacter pfennigii]
MTRCSQCKYFLKNGKPCEFACYKDVINESQLDMQMACDDNIYIDYLLNKVVC